MKTHTSGQLRLACKAARGIALLLMVGAIGGELVYSIENPQRQNRKKTEETGKKQQKPGKGMDFKALDTDGDGFLSFEEFSGSARLMRIDEAKRRKLFDYLDRNKDGKLDMRELRPHQPRWMVDLREQFKRYDLDKSGGLDIKEFSKVPYVSKMEQREKMHLFKRLDANKDRAIQLSELKVTPGQKPLRRPPGMDVKKFDIDKSGGMSFEEYIKMPWVSRMPKERQKNLFRKIDINDDGEISPKEVKEVWAGRRGHGRPHPGKPHGPKTKRQPPKGEEKKQDGGKS